VTGLILRHLFPQVYRYTQSALYTVYDVNNDHHLPITLSDSSKIQQTRLDYATWAANTSVLILIANNDIYVRYSPLSGVDYRITNTGQPDIYYNGVPDWLYQGKNWIDEENLRCQGSVDVTVHIDRRQRPVDCVWTHLKLPRCMRLK
jgi:Dipeptidyl peptidase IV (DPP IV) N-terminal region.